LFLFEVFLHFSEGDDLAEEIRYEKMEECEDPSADAAGGESD